MFSKKSQLALALVCVLGTGALLTGTQEPRAADTPAAAKAAAPAVEVTVITTKAADIAMESTLSGRTSAYRVAEVRPQVSGILLKRLFEEGAEVKEGQPLYQIDDATYKAALETAKAQLAQAQATLVQARADAKRSAELVKIKAVSEQSNRPRRRRPRPPCFRERPPSVRRRSISTTPRSVLRFRAASPAPK